MVSIEDIEKAANYLIRNKILSNINHGKKDVPPIYQRLIDQGIVAVKIKDKHEELNGVITPTIHKLALEWIDDYEFALTEPEHDNEEMWEYPFNDHLSKQLKYFGFQTLGELKILIEDISNHHFGVKKYVKW